MSTGIRCWGRTDETSALFCTIEKFFQSRIILVHCFKRGGGCRKWQRCAILIPWTKVEGLKLSEVKG